MQPPASAKVTQERWRPPPESSFTVIPVCPERCHAREVPQNAAERSWWCSLCDTTPCPALTHAVHCHGLPSCIYNPSTCHLVKLHSPPPTALLPSPEGGGRRAEGGGRERGAVQASKQVTDAIVTPKNRGGGGMGGGLTHPRRPPIIFLSLSI